MLITRQTVADKIADHLQHRITLAQLVDWAEAAMLEANFPDEEADVLAEVVSRLGVADVREFGLTWADFEDLLRRLGFSARIQIVTQ